MRTDRYEEDADAPRRGGIGAWVTLILLIVGGLYAAALAAGRTPGFKGYVRDRLEEALSFPITVDRAYLSFQLAVVFEGVATPEGLVAGRPGLQIERLVLRLVPWRLGSGGIRAVKAVEADNVYISIAQGESGGWQPARLVPVVQRVAAWLGADGPSHALETAEEALANILFSRRLTVRNARVVWYGASGVSWQIAGMDWQNRILRAAQEILMYRAVSVAQVQHGDGRNLSNVRVDFLQTAERTIVLNYGVSRSKPGNENAFSGKASDVKHEDYLQASPPDERDVLQSALREALGATLEKGR